MVAGTQRVANDRRVLLEKAYENYGADLYRYALMILADHGAAEDAVQQAFIKLMKIGKRILEIESSDGYLRTVVRNECYGIIKKRQQSDNVVKVLSSKPILEKTSREIIGEDERKLIEAAIRKLPADQREVLHMKVYEDKTFREIGKMIGVSLNTAASRYRYAMDKLREILVLGNEAKGQHE